MIDMRVPSETVAMGRALPPPLFAGVGVALITLFDEAGDLLSEATAEHAARLVDLGVRAIVLAGTTGEPWFLTEAERVQLIRACRARLPAGIPVIAGTGHPDVDMARRMTAAAQRAGADAALVLSLPQTDDQRPYFAAVAAAAPGLPLLAYHLPLLSPPGVAVAQISELGVRGIKDSSGDAERLAAELEGYDGELYVGSAALLSLAGPLGATGAILAVANHEPERCVLAFSGDAQAQRQLLGPHLDSLVEFPAALKVAVAKRFATPSAVRTALPAQ
jgi:dihydrodipicolinate synthase/N-acetylneuraminate lyase